MPRIMQDNANIQNNTGRHFTELGDFKAFFILFNPWCDSVKWVSPSSSFFPLIYFVPHLTSLEIWNAGTGTASLLKEPSFNHHFSTLAVILFLDKWFKMGPEMYKQKSHKMWWRWAGAQQLTPIVKFRGSPRKRSWVTFRLISSFLRRETWQEQKEKKTVITLSEIFFF